MLREPIEEHIGVKHSRILAASTLLLCAAEFARAGDIAAVVEEVSGPHVTVKPMDLLEAGHVVDLSDGGTIVLGYLLSCIRETIKGGKVTIGSEESVIDHGIRSVEEVDCDGGRAVRSNNEASDVAGAVFREGGSEEPLPKPDWTLFGTSPVFKFSQAVAAIKIERIDKSEAAISLDVAAGWVDTADAGVELEPSGLYAITTAGRVHVLKISPLAEADAPLLSRLVPM